jgi:ADP-ribose pyrophosphatase
MGFQLAGRRTIYDGQRMKLELVQLKDEERGLKLTKEIVAHPGAVIVLPLLADGRVVLIRNHRWSIGKYLVELPAGTLEKSEPPINCAGRELLEETGYLAGRITPLASFYTSPGILSEKMHAFVATQLEKQQAAPEDGEEIETVPTPFEDAIQMIRDGEIVDGKTIATLLMYERFHR